MQPTQDKSSESYKHSTPQSQLLEMQREFAVPVERLFAAFKTPEALKAWWWPNGMYSDKIDLEFQEGGKYFINMNGYDQAGGGGMTGKFIEIIENERIVMSDQFADKEGHAISPQEAKMPGVWPPMAYITLEFKSVGEAKSQLLLSQEGIPNELQKDCIQGWSESFDKLESYLSERKQ